MALFWEVEEAAWDALHLRGVEGLHALSVGDAEVFSAVDDQNRGVPVAHELVRRDVVACRHRVCPIGASDVVIGEEEFLGSAVPTL